MKRYLIILLIACGLASCNLTNTNDALITTGPTLSKFRFESSVSTEQARDVVSVCSMKDIKVEKHQHFTTIDSLGMTIVETYYVNLGQPLTVKGYEMQRHILEPKDTVVWSLQPSSSSARMDWVLPVKPGFEKENYLGMNNTDYGGGIPVLDLWEKEGGIAIGLTENVLKMIKMPVSWKQFESKVEFALRYDFPWAVEFNKGDTLRTFGSFEMTHEGDYFNALRNYSEYMQSEQGIELQPSEPEAFEPVWCAWGYDRLFTLDNVIGTLDKVQELGFRWVDVDDGYQIAEGDWDTNERFPGGDADMRRLTDEIHKRGLLAKLWWAPLAADPDTKLLKEHPEMRLMTEEWAPEYITWWDSFYLSPVNPAVEQYTNDLLKKFLDIWNFDGLKIDGQHLNCCMPDYNEASQLEYPEQAIEQMPTYFKNVMAQTRIYKSNPVVQICPCGCAMNYFHIPYFNQAVASDPTSSMQVRMKRKAYAAMAPQLAYYGDHVELTDGGKDFASQIGVGAVIGTKFTYPADNEFARESFLLTPEKEEWVRKWVNIYKEKNLARGEYLNLYTWGFDYPEGHVIRQNDALYYAFYADEFEGDIELRGLEKGKEYTVTEYTLDEPRSYTVSGDNPVITINFNNNYLIEVK